MRTFQTVSVVGLPLVAVLLSTGVLAQDSNTLNRHLEHQQWQRLQDHQMESRKMDVRRQKTAVRAQSQACSADALPAADRRRMEADYMRRLRADGKASADAWVREQGRKFRLKLVAEGICPGPDGKKRIARTDTSDKSEEGCDMVMRPVAGLGGAPMTMAMVPDCGGDDDD